MSNDQEKPLSPAYEPMTVRGNDGRAYKTERMERRDKEAGQHETGIRSGRLLATLLRAPD
ncbi:hypothetical protein FF80_01255 [Devosia sp. LC5]|uniref:hypothetical protein n=1 Tax=Devosia sp. LC5 TaxID=1502724 RepID=UPI0004E2D246|nr:hypothetical protein [Devosia sp. LC5]KFC69751.1 hypothetical protein FF80_01255 [Devosia sp. LC5]